MWAGPLAPRINRPPWRLATRQGQLVLKQAGGSAFYSSMADARHNRSKTGRALACASQQPTPHSTRRVVQSCIACAECALHASHPSSQTPETSLGCDSSAAKCRASRCRPTQLCPVPGARQVLLLMQFVHEMYVLGMLEGIADHAALPSRRHAGMVEGRADRAALRCAAAIMPSWGTCG